MPTWQLKGRVLGKRPLWEEASGPSGLSWGTAGWKRRVWHVAGEVEVRDEGTSRSSAREGKARRMLWHGEGGERSPARARAGELCVRPSAGGCSGRRFGARRETSVRCDRSRGARQ